MPVALGTPLSNPRLSRVEAANFLGVTRSALSAWAVRGNGPPYIKIGAKVVYLQSDLDAWLASRRITHTAELA